MCSSDLPTPGPLRALVRAIRLACGRATAMVTLVEADEALHVVCDGAPVAEATPRELAFCSHAILGQDLYEVPDLSVDPRFARHPLVREPGGPRHYAAMPLVLEGQALGTLCVLDPTPGPLEAGRRWVTDVSSRHATGDRSVPVPFAGKALSLLRRRGFTPEESRRYFAIIYQIRRAFCFIERGLVGRSECMKQLRRHQIGRAHV